MPRKKEAVVLGYIQCPTCDLKMSVLQCKRNYLYTVCDECGCDRRYGTKPQSILYYKTEWKDGPPPRPNPVPAINPFSTPVHVPEEPSSDEASSDSGEPVTVPEKLPETREKDQELNDEEHKKVPLSLLAVAAGITFFWLR